MVEGLPIFCVVRSCAMRNRLPVLPPHEGTYTRRGSSAVSLPILHRGVPHRAHTKKPTWMEHHPHSDHVYAADSGADELIEIDLGSWAVTRRMPAEGAPYNLALTPEGPHIIVSLKGAAAIGVYDVTTGREVARLQSSRSMPHGIAVSPDGKYAFVSAEGIGSEPGVVDVTDLRRLQRVASATAGRRHRFLESRFIGLKGIRRQRPTHYTPYAYQG